MARILDSNDLWGLLLATFSVKKGTIFYRLKTDPVRVMLVITLLAHGCPVQAIVAAFGFDKRTVTDWWKRAGQHCQQFHEHMVENSQLDLQQVQGGTLWIAIAMMVSLMVFHSPQSLHWPAHLEWLAPQALLVYCVFALAIFYI